MLDQSHASFSNKMASIEVEWKEGEWEIIGEGGTKGDVKGFISAINVRTTCRRSTVYC